MDELSSSAEKVWLAIIIPAYKGSFLAEALASIAAQTDRRFRVYVGDDASPEDLRKICDEFQADIDLKYCRFEEKFGGKSLVDQWCRCIELSTEPWIWLFADDDVMEKGCVDCFYRGLEETRGAYDVYRFNTLTIDGGGRVIKVNRPHPEHESALEFAYHRLRGNRDSYASEYLFSRQIYNKCGGMTRFPLAWCADDATWISFAAARGIRTISGPHVLWRRSGLNITSLKGATIPAKLEAAAMFADGLTARFSDADFADSKVPRTLFEEAQRDWFFGQLRSMAPLPRSLWLNWPKFPKILSEHTRRQIFARLIYIHLCWMSQSVVRGMKKVIDRPSETSD